MLFKKYSQFIDLYPINENLDKAKKFMKDSFLLSSAAKKLNLIDDQTDYDIKNGNKRMVTPLDFINLDPDKRKELTNTMKGIEVSDELMRSLITSEEFKKIREIKTNIDGVDYQLDRDNIGWLYNFVYFYYYENASLEDLSNLYGILLSNKDILSNLEIIVDGKSVNKAFDLNFINIRVPNNLELLLDGLEKLKNLRLYKKMEVDLPPHLKRDLKESPKIIKDRFLEVAMAFDVLGGDGTREGRDDKKHEELYKGFFGRVMLDDREGSKTKGQMVFRSPVSRYKNIREFIEKALAYANATGNDNFNTFYQKFQECNIRFGVNGADEIFNENGIFIIEVKSFGANRVLNSHTGHCIKDTQGSWDSYVVNDRERRATFENRQYYIYNFNLMQSNTLFTIGVTIEPDERTNYIRAAHDKVDGNCSSRIIDILKKWETEYDVEEVAKEYAKQLGAKDSEISKLGGLFSLLRPISGEEVERRKRIRTANIEIVKAGTTMEQFKQYVTVDGADINREQCKALEWAVKENNIEKAKLILSLGGSPNLKPKRESIINDATSLDMIKLLVENGSELTPQVYNNICHDIEAVEFCLKNGLDPSFEDSLPLRRSCKGSWKGPNDIGESYMDAIKLLLKYGASLTDKRGRYMILNWAVEYGRTEVVDYIVENGASMGFISAYSWLGHSRKINNIERKKCAEHLIELSENFEKAELERFPEEKKWHLKL